MNFKLWLETRYQVTEEFKRRIYDKITTVGISVNRGEKPKRGEFASDPGDFGRGIYYDTSIARARSYGPVKKSILVLKNPLVVTEDEAYALADQFQTVRLKQPMKWEEEREQLLKNAKKMTDYMLSQGHDGLVSIRQGGLEIVDYRPYATNADQHSID